MQNKILWISTFEKIGNKTHFMNYLVNAKNAIKKNNVKIKFISTHSEKLKGKKFQRIVCLEFNKISDAKRFFKSKDYVKARSFLKKAKSVRHLNLIKI
jgi:uncharacterized protein (DUF1330 family)